jgi:hypothetical protein
MADPAPNNACRNPQDNRGGGGVMPNASSQHAGLWGWFEGAYSRTVSTAESAYHDVAGAVDHGYNAATHAIEAGYTVVTDEMRSYVNSVPDRIANAANWPQLRYWAEIALGAESFNVGVGVGMVKNLADGVLGLLQMLKMFVLAGLYEQAHASSPQVAATASPQTYLIAKAADLVLGAQMKAADEQARALVKEVGHLVANPGQLLTALGQQYKEKWDRFAELSKQNSISSRFESGEIVGDVLMDIIMLVQLAEGAAKLASKIPKLLEEAEKLAAKVPEIAKAARELGAVKKAESLERLAKDAEAIKEPVKTVRPQVKSSNRVPAVAEDVATAPKDPPKAPPPKAPPPPKKSYGTYFFGKDILPFIDKPDATLGVSGKAHFFMPLEDASEIDSVADAARESGMPRSIAQAYRSGGDAYGVSFPNDGLPIRQPTLADADGWPHFLEGGHTAIRLDGDPGGYLVNSTREFVTPGGSPMPPGSVLFKIGSDGGWIPLRQW